MNSSLKFSFLDQRVLQLNKMEKYFFFAVTIVILSFCSTSSQMLKINIVDKRFSLGDAYTKNCYLPFHERYWWISNMDKFRQKKKCNVHFSGITPEIVDAPRHFPLINRGWGSEGPPEQECS